MTKMTQKRQKTEVMLKLCTETMCRGLGTKCHHLRFMTHLVCVCALFNNLIKNIKDDDLISELPSPFCTVSFLK